MTDLDLDKGHVFVRQDWRYHWVDNPALPPWTHDEQFDFHRRLDRVIWTHWSLRARLQVRAAQKQAQHAQKSNDLVTRFGSQGLTLSFDVRSVVGPAHWRASVLKVDSDQRPFPRSQTDFARRTLELHSIDVEPHFASRTKHDPRKQSNVFVAAHEFGHAIGYANPCGHLDEYFPKSPFLEDVHSIMNIGRHIRARHLSLITETLEKMVHGTKFHPVVEAR